MGLFYKIKEIARKMLPKKSIENSLNISPAISDRMTDAIHLWSDMYEGRSPWLREPTYDNPTRIVSLGLPALISSEKARMATLEMKTEITAPVKEVSVMDGESTDISSVNTDDTAQTISEAQPAIGSNSTDTVGGGASYNITASTAYQQKTKLLPEGSTERANFLNEQYQKLIRQIRRQLEYGIAKGGIVIKPYIVMYDSKNFDNSRNDATERTDTISTDKNIDNSTNEAGAAQNQNKSNSRLSYSSNLSNAEIEFDFIQADRFFPMAFDANGKVIEAAFIQTKVNKARERVYIRLEYHKLEKRRVTVYNFAFESTDMSLANSNNIRSATNLGKQINLTDVDEWASLQPTTVIDNVDRLLFAYFRMPEANTIDPYSPLGVSGFSRAADLIKDADMQYSRLLWEFEGGELAIDVDRDALKFVTDPNGEGKSVLPTNQQRLFRKVDLNAEDTYKVFAPPLRDTSIVNGLNTILTRIEDICGLSRGTLSEVDSMTAKTATELKILKQRSYATNADIQAALQCALEDAVYVMDVYATLYDVTAPGNYEVSFEWDDSIIVDSESELSKRITLMQNGLASKVETRMWYFGETENQAKAALRRIEEESTQAVLQNIQAEIIKSKAGLTTAQSESDTDSDETQKSISDTTSDKKSTGKQADSLDNPDKSKSVDQIKG